MPYFHLVFTLPHELNHLAQGNPRLIYALLFETVSATLIEFGANPRWLGGTIAATLVLHTWAQTLTPYLHVHALVAGGALGPAGQWISPRRGFLFPVKTLSTVFRGKFLHGLSDQLQRGDLMLAGSTAPLADPGAQRTLLAQLRAHSWVVYAKPCLAGPEQVLDYLGRYVQRVAICNERLLDLEDGQVRFRYRDRAHGNRRKVMRLPVHEFLARFLTHVLPRGSCASAITGCLPIATSACGSLKRVARSTPHLPHRPPWSRSPPSACACSVLISTCAPLSAAGDCASSVSCRRRRD